jgi:glucose/arabinose dehydrogenase
MPAVTHLAGPAGIAIDRASAVLVADDVGNTIWRVTPEAAVSAKAVR